MTIDRYEIYGSTFGPEVEPEGQWVRYEDHAAEIARLRAEVARLREALQPFAELAKDFDEDLDLVGLPDDYGVNVSLGECRAARAAMELKK